MPLLTDMVRYSVILCYFFKISPVFIDFNLIQPNPDDPEPNIFATKLDYNKPDTETQMIYLLFFLRGLL